MRTFVNIVKFLVVSAITLFIVVSGIGVGLMISESQGLLMGILGAGSYYLIVGGAFFIFARRRTEAGLFTLSSLF